MTEPGKETAEAAVRDLHKVEAEMEQAGRDIEKAKAEIGDAEARLRKAETEIEEAEQQRWGLEPGKSANEELLYLFFFSREGRSVALSNSLMHRSIAA